MWNLCTFFILYKAYYPIQRKKEKVIIIKIKKKKKKLNYKLHLTFKLIQFNKILFFKKKSVVNNPQNNILSFVCQAFPTTLKGPARIWFNRLTPNSINTFKELSVQFASHFIGGHMYKKSTACLMSIKQWEDKILRSYIARFNKETLSIDKADDKILVTAFTNGLRKGKFLFSLYKNDL